MTFPLRCFGAYVSCVCTPPSSPYCGSVVMAEAPARRKSGPRHPRFHDATAGAKAGDMVVFSTPEVGLARSLLFGSESLPELEDRSPPLVRLHLLQKGRVLRLARDEEARPSPRQGRWRALWSALRERGRTRRALEAGPSLSDQTTYSPFRSRALLCSSPFPPRGFRARRMSRLFGATCPSRWPAGVRTPPIREKSACTWPSVLAQPKWAHG